MAIYKLGDKIPVIDESVYIADEATVIGQVTLGKDTSIWSQAVLRADNEPIQIGEGCNVQEGAVLHADPGFPLTVEDHVTVGHQAMLHGCTIGAGSLIGIQAAILNGAVIGRNCLVAAGALITQGKTFPDNSLILGRPAKVVRELSEDQIANLHRTAREYAERGTLFQKNLVRID